METTTTTTTTTTTPYYYYYSHKVEILTQTKADKTAVQHLLFQFEQAAGVRAKKEAEQAKVRVRD